MKRSLLTDARGIPLGVVVAGANINDHKLLADTLAAVVVRRPKASPRRPHGLCLDKGYDYPVTRVIARRRRLVLHLRTRGEECQRRRRSKRYRARRWVVERTHSWLNRFRRLLVRWEKKADNYLGLLHCACAIITFQQGGLFG